MGNPPIQGTPYHALRNLSSETMKDGYQLIESPPVSRPVKQGPDNGLAMFLAAFIAFIIGLPAILSHFS